MKFHIDGEGRPTYEHDGKVFHPVLLPAGGLVLPALTTPNPLPKTIPQLALVLIQVIQHHNEVIGLLQEAGLVTIAD
jgi:hypothetical protein